MPRRAAISPARLALVGLLTLPALWIATASTTADILAGGNPALALKFWPWNADAHGQLASNLVVVDASRPQIDQARILAWKALAREPVSIPAVRSIALADDLQGRPRAGRLFDYAERLSRRDLATQIWMIEAAVGKGDIRGALVHYDRALRTRKEAEPLLLPVMVSAMATQGMQGPIGDLIATRPLWWPRFMEQALADPTAINSLPLVFSRLRVSPADEQGRGFLSTGIASLVATGRYKAALDVYRIAMRGIAGQDAALRDGGFERDPLLPPFDWQLADGADVSAMMQTRGAGGRALFAAPIEGGRGELARQLLVLPAGRYRLGWRAGSIAADGARLTLKIQCVAGKELHDVALRQLSPAPETGRLDMPLPFTVPANGCSAQWVILSVDNPGAVPETLPWIDDVRVERQPA